jgi:PleD family two-component response regulator
LSSTSNTIELKEGEEGACELSEDGKQVSISGLNVLVAEDNRTSRKVIEILLKKLGVEVFVVDDGQQVLDQVEKLKPDVILMDCHPHQTHKSLKRGKKGLVSYQRMENKSLFLV